MLRAKGATEGLRLLSFSARRDHRYGAALPICTPRRIRLLVTSVKRDVRLRSLRTTCYLGDAIHFVLGDRAVRERKAAAQRLRVHPLRLSFSFGFSKLEVAAKPPR